MQITTSATRSQKSPTVVSVAFAIVGIGLLAGAGGTDSGRQVTTLSPWSSSSYDMMRSYVDRSPPDTASTSR